MAQTLVQKMGAALRTQKQRAARLQAQLNAKNAQVATVAKRNANLRAKVNQASKSAQAGGGATGMLLVGALAVGAFLLMNRGKRGR